MIPTSSVEGGPPGYSGTSFIYPELHQSQQPPSTISSPLPSPTAPSFCSEACESSKTEARPFFLKRCWHWLVGSSQKKQSTEDIERAFQTVLERQAASVANKEQEASQLISENLWLRTCLAKIESDKQGTESQLEKILALPANDKFKRLAIIAMKDKEITKIEADRVAMSRELCDQSLHLNVDEQERKDLQATVTRQSNDLKGLQEELSSAQNTVALKDRIITELRTENAQGEVRLLTLHERCGRLTTHIEALTRDMYSIISKEEREKLLSLQQTDNVLGEKG